MTWRFTAPGSDAPGWPDEGRFRCLPGCGLCCSYRVVVSPADQERLEAAGLEVSWAEAERGALALPRPLVVGRLDGFCLFLQSDRRCGVYPHRPGQCRTFPYLPAAYEKPEIDVAYACPGLGSGEGEPRELARLLASPPRVLVVGRRHSAGCRLSGAQAKALEHLEGLLQGRLLFAPGDVLAACGHRFVARLEEIWPSPLQVGPVLGPMINLEGESDAATAWERLALPLEEAPADEAFLARHFGPWRRNTRFTGPGAVQLYRFRWNDGRWEVREGGATATFGPLVVGRLEERPWAADGLAIRRAYLLRWLHRQGPIRYAHHTSAASPWPQHSVVSYLQFLAEADRRVHTLGQAVAAWRGQPEVGAAEAMEAVRGSDAPLRAWCEAAQTAIPASGGV